MVPRIYIEFLNSARMIANIGIKASLVKTRNMHYYCAIKFFNRQNQAIVQDEFNKKKSTKKLMRTD